jgi:hypothetical protein
VPRKHDQPCSGAAAFAVKVSKKRSTLTISNRSSFKRTPQATKANLDSKPGYGESKAYFLPVMKSCNCFNAPGLDARFVGHPDGAMLERMRGCLIRDGMVVHNYRPEESVRNWTFETPEAIPDPRTGSIRGGTVRRVEKPQKSRSLAPQKTKVIRWNGRGRLCRLSPRTGELWLCGTAGSEVMIPISSGWVRTHWW